MRPDRIGAGENFLHVLRARVGRDVDVFRNLTANKIPYASACEVGNVAGCAQSIHERASGRKHRFFLNPGGIHILTLAGRAAAVETATYASSGSTLRRPRVAEGVDHEANDRNTDAGIGHVE